MLECECNYSNSTVTVTHFWAYHVIQSLNSACQCSRTPKTCPFRRPHLFNLKTTFDILETKRSRVPEGLDQNCLISLTALNVWSPCQTRKCTHTALLSFWSGNFWNSWATPVEVSAWSVNMWYVMLQAYNGHMEALHVLLQAYNGHNEALHVLLGYMMNLDVKDVNGAFTSLLHLVLLPFCFTDSRWRAICVIVETVQKHCSLLSFLLCFCCSRLAVLLFYRQSMSYL